MKIKINNMDHAEEIFFGSLLTLLVALLITSLLFVSGYSQAFSEKQSPSSIIGEGDFYRWGLLAIGAPGAWSSSKGSEEVVVAVIDSGVDFSVDPLRDARWFNEDEIPGDHRDNDDNGYVDDISGWDFQDFDSSSAKGTEINYHGTFIAGIICALYDSATGIGGVAPGVKIMDLRVLDGKGQLYTTDWGKLVGAIDYAVNNGADIINLSIYSTLKPPGSVRSAIKRAVEENVLVVGIPGNSGNEVQYFGQWEEILTVGAVDRDKRPWNYSNHGTEVDLVGPGVDVMSIVPGGEVEKRSGTSFAAAHVTGAAALILSKNPDLSAYEIEYLLKNSAKDMLDSGYDPKTGYGLIDVEGALRSLG